MPLAQPEPYRPRLSSNTCQRTQAQKGVRSEKLNGAGYPTYDDSEGTFWAPAREAARKTPKEAEPRHGLITQSTAPVAASNDGNARRKASATGQVSVST